MLMSSRRPRSHTADDDRGAALISVIVIALVLGIITVTLSAAVVNTTRTTVGVRGSLQAQAAADAGLAAGVAAARGGEVCAATVDPGTVPGSGGGAAYTATIACDAAETSVTITSTGTASGRSSTVQAVYSLVAETTEVIDPSLTPVGLVLYDASTMGQVSLLAHGGNEPQVIAVTGTFGCRLAIPGNLIVGGDVTSSDGCNVSGDVYAGGTITFNGSATTVLGDITAAGTGTTRLNSAIGSPTPSAPLSTVRTGGPVDFLWGEARIHANVIANGAVRVPRIVNGSVTLPTGITPTLEGIGRIDRGVVNTSIATVPPPPLPEWYDYAYRASDWPSPLVIRLRNVTADATDTCDYFNRSTGWRVNGTYVGGSNRGWTDLANYTGTVVIDARACTELSSNAGGDPSPALKASNVVLLARKFNLTGLTMTSAPEATPRVWFVTEDTVDDNRPTCPLPPTRTGETATNFDTNGADLDGVRSLIYTPCRLSVSGGGVLLGSLYTNGFNSGGEITIKGELMALPGMDPPDGGYGGTPVLVETGERTLGTVVSRRDVGAP